MVEKQKPREPIGFTRKYLPVYEDSPASLKKRLVYRVSPEITISLEATDTDLGQAIMGLPETIRPMAAELAADPLLNQGIMETTAHWLDFGSREKAMLVGMYLDAAARKRSHEMLDDQWGESSAESGETFDEVVIGSGLHAAIYCAVRAALGKPKPIVLERRRKVGGSFALNTGPSFFMNSRNRPGPLSIPGERGALNVVPGSIVQPSDLGGEEFQTNEVLAWIVRQTLAMHASVIPNAPVRAVEPYSKALNVIVFENGTRLYARRVIVATGIGLPKDSTNIRNEKVICFDQFMQMLSQPFPLKGMRRISVIGGGDGARTAIEALTGQGPPTMSAASADWPERIDWYGSPWNTCQDVIADARVRYKRMASLFPDPVRPNRPSRVRPFPRAEAISAGYDVVYVSQMPYDFLIDCTGYIRNTMFDPEAGQIGTLAVANEIRVGRKLGEEIYVIGPAAELEVGESEQEVLRNIDENRTSLFRYAPRTAALAASLS